MHALPALRVPAHRGAERRAHQQTGPLSVSWIDRQNQLSPSGRSGSPVAAVSVTRFEVAISNALVTCVLKFRHCYLQRLLGDPSFALFSIAFVEVGQIRVLEKNFHVANNRGWQDENYFFFGYDFVLAALEAQIVWEGYQ